MTHANVIKDSASNLPCLFPLFRHNVAECQINPGCDESVTTKPYRFLVVVAQPVKQGAPKTLPITRLDNSITSEEKRVGKALSLPNTHAQRGEENLHV